MQWRSDLFLVLSPQVRPLASSGKLNDALKEHANSVFFMYVGLTGDANKLYVSTYKFYVSTSKLYVSTYKLYVSSYRLYVSTYKLYVSTYELYDLQTLC